MFSTWCSLEPAKTLISVPLRLCGVVFVSLLSASVRREAVEVAVTAGTDEVLLRTAARCVR